MNVAETHETFHRAAASTNSALAALGLRHGQAARAARLAAAARALAEPTGGELADAILRAGDPLEEARALLPAEEDASAVEDGGGLTLQVAVDYARSLSATGRRGLDRLDLPPGYRASVPRR